jgi:hypothetical protein
MELRKQKRKVAEAFIVVIVGAAPNLEKETAGRGEVSPESENGAEAQRGYSGTWESSHGSERGGRRDGLERGIKVSPGRM